MILKKYPEDAVSPVVGVMLMLVVTIIIAAVVSGFAGGMMDSHDVAPQATIKGSYSIADGLVIRHTGGDPLPMHDLNVIIWDGPTFGQDIEIISKQVLNNSLFKTADGERIFNADDGTYNVSAFRAGEAIYISPDECKPYLLQPDLTPSDYDPDDGANYNPSLSPNPEQDSLLWSMCLMNRKNIGNEFFISLSDNSGNLIAKATALVTA